MRTVVLLALMCTLFQCALSSHFFCWPAYFRTFYMICLKNAMTVTTSNSSVIDDLKDREYSWWSCFYHNNFRSSIEEQLYKAMCKYYSVSKVRLIVGNETKTADASTFPIDIEVSIDGKVDEIKKVADYYANATLKSDSAQITKLSPSVVILNCKRLSKEGKELFNCPDELNKSKSTTAAATTMA